MCEEIREILMLAGDSDEVQKRLKEILAPAKPRKKRRKRDKKNTWVTQLLQESKETIITYTSNFDW